MEPELQPAPEPRPERAPSPAPGRRQLAPLPEPAKKLLLAAALAITAAVGTHAILGTPTPPPQELTAEASSQRLAAFEGAGTVELPPVNVGDPAELREAMVSMALESEEESEQLLGDLQRGAVRLIWLELWDDVYEDGDTVAVIAGSFARVVPLTNAPARIALPLPPGLGHIQIRGVQDGRGGITVALRTPSGVVPLPQMLKGQVINVPVAF